MSPETLRYASIMLLTGIGIPVLAALNAQLGNRIGSSAAAATVLFVVVHPDRRKQWRRADSGHC